MPGLVEDALYYIHKLLVHLGLAAGEAQLVPVGGLGNNGVNLLDIVLHDFVHVNAGLAESFEMRFSHLRGGIASVIVIPEAGGYFVRLSAVENSLHSLNFIHKDDSPPAAWNLPEQRLSVNF